ncbi:hypothetical protein [Novipirellula maiorica]|nr:hypothetical protein [Rhodopirellula maiorica]
MDIPTRQPIDYSALLRVTEYFDSLQRFTAKVFAVFRSHHSSITSWWIGTPPQNTIDPKSPSAASDNRVISTAHLSFLSTNGFLMSWSSSSKIFFLLIFLLSTGCGGGGTPTSVAEDDEIAQYLSENPEAAETDLDVDVNVENDE